MTPTRYFIARFVQAFGYQRKNQRMGDAASEMHLLREAEAELGSLIWQKVENIEDLSVEYWNLRKIVREREEVQKKMAVCNERLQKAHEERAMVLNETPEAQQDLIAKRTALLNQLEKQTVKRDEIITQARDVRRSYDGLKTKLEVVSQEAANEAEVAQVKTRLTELKQKFADLKQLRAEIGTAIEQSDEKIGEVEKLLSEEKKNLRINASEAFQTIGDSNKEMASLRAEEGVLETQMRQLQAEIGRFVSRNYDVNPDCAKAAASHRGLIDVMRAIRRSIALNHRLAGTA